MVMGEVGNLSGFGELCQFEFCITILRPFNFDLDPSFWALLLISSGRLYEVESMTMIERGVRVGLGHDRHRLVTGRPLILGGVFIEFELGLEGHSDADVLLHAVTDAILGAVGLGDIGEWFPNTDPQWANQDSAIFLQQAIREARQRGWEIGNLDCTVHAERPKLTPYKREISDRIASLLGIEANQVNVKAKTGEKVGPVGRLEAIDADAIVLMVRT